MRKRFVQKLELGQVPIEELTFNIKSKSAINDLLRSLQAIYLNKEYNEKIFTIMEKYINANKKATGRPGMNLWTIFVLAQVRLCLNLSYDELCNFANEHISLRNLLGYKYTFINQLTKIEYQNIYDNVSKLSNDMIIEINEVIVEFGNKKVFKKKEDEPVYHLKTDSFVVESNVHFPTDYNLLYDCIKKILGIIEKLSAEIEIKGWRKLGNWRSKLKSMMRDLGKISASGGKNKAKRLEEITEKYLNKAKKLEKKVETSNIEKQVKSVKQLNLIKELKTYMNLMKKHIDLVERRILKGEKIPHSEKIFSIYENYTEWINKGKSRPNVELGKMLSITTNQHNLIIHQHLHQNQKDSQIVKTISEDILKKYKVGIWSFDKGYYSKENKKLLQKEVKEVIMPKKGKKNKLEKIEESTRQFKKYRRAHSAIESNINELEHRGLDRCPDRGEEHFKTYISLGITAYNLKKIGKELRTQDRKAAKQKIQKQKRLLIKVA